MCRRPRILLGASGSVAAIKVAELADLLAEFAEVKLVLTKAARHFVTQEDLPFEILGTACSFVFMARHMPDSTSCQRDSARCFLMSLGSTCLL